MNKKKFRFIVKITKITFPDGKKRTGFTAFFDPKGQVYMPDADTINEVIPRLDEEYNKLVENYKKKGINDLQKFLDVFLRNVSHYVIIKEGLKEVLSADLNLSVKDIEEKLRRTSWFKEVIEYIKKEFRKIKKDDPVKYAEDVCQLVGLFGLDKALSLLNKEGVKVKRSTVNSLCRVAGETPKIKQLIREGKLKLTIAFELPRVSETEREKIAEELSSLSYAEAKKYLRIV